MIFDEVKGVVSKIINVDEQKIKPETLFVENLGADSLDVAEIAMAFEERFNIELLDNDIVNIKTVGDMVKAIEERVKNKE